MEEIKNLNTYDILSCQYDTVIQILKQISDGYLVLDYSPNYNNFGVRFLSFQDIIQSGYKLDNGLWKDTFSTENIRHIDEFGYCEPINNF